MALPFLGIAPPDAAVLDDGGCNVIVDALVVPHVILLWMGWCCRVNRHYCVKMPPSFDALSKNTLIQTISLALQCRTDIHPRIPPRQVPGCRHRPTDDPPTDACKEGQC